MFLDQTDAMSHRRFPVPGAVLTIPLN